MFKKGLLALALVFSLPVFAAEHWIDVRVPEQYQQEHVQGAINIPLKEVKERIATAVPDKNDTVKVYCNAGRQSGQAKEILSEMGYTLSEPQLAEFGYLTMLPIGELRKNGYTLPSIVMGLRSNHFRL